MSQSWFAIRTAPQREFLLAGRHDGDGSWLPGLLEKKGYSKVFCPTETKYRKTIRKGRRVSIPVLYPMFTGYIFIGGDFSWLHLMAENYIQGVIGFPDEYGNRRPAPISESEMEKLRAMSGGLVPHRRSVNPHRAWRIGEKAEIAVGPYQGQITDIVGLHGRWAQIFVNLFGARRLVTILSEHLEAA